MKYFISGHRNITEEEFMLHYSPRILDALRDPNAEFVVGDYDGVDTIAQHFLIGKTDKLTVYHMHDKPMHNDGDWKTMGDYNSDIHRDSTMTVASDVDIAWIRTWGDNSGTEQNVLRRAKLNN